MSLRTGLEPVRVEPNGFQVHLLNHSDTAAVAECGIKMRIIGKSVERRNDKNESESERVKC